MADILPDNLWQIRITGYYPQKAMTKPHRKKPIPKGEFNPPKYEIDSFARCILPAIQAYFDTEAGRREFAEWMTKQQTENKTA